MAGAREHVTTAFHLDEERIEARAISAHSGEIIDEFVVMAGET